MREQFLTLKNEAIADILSAEDRNDLENVRTDYLGKKGKLNLLMKDIPNLPLNVRPELGKLANEVKVTIEETLQTRMLEVMRDTDTDATSFFDITLPGKKPKRGHFSPQTQVLAEVARIFEQIGFQLAEGPDVVDDYYNFEVLNLPAGHPSRDTQQTLYLEDVFDKNGNPLLLRTHTSSMQVKIMENTKPPLRVLIPGKVFRNEATDASHGFEFLQLEGFAIDENISMTDMFGTIDYFYKSFFGKDTQVRFVCHNFRYVEPGAEAYITCTVCRGKGCSFCKHSGWVEVLGAGMIHPQVLKNAGINPDKYQGFAFGMGLSRLITMKYQIDDLRVLTNADMRIIEQF